MSRDVTNFEGNVILQQLRLQVINEGEGLINNFVHMRHIRHGYFIYKSLISAVSYPGWMLAC